MARHRIPAADAAAVPKVKYRQRWQPESVFSRHKLLLDDALRHRSPDAWVRECPLRVLTHNVMILAA